MLPIDEALPPTNNHVHIPVAARIGSDFAQVVHHCSEVDVSRKRDRIVSMYEFGVRHSHVAYQNFCDARIEYQVAEVDGHCGRVG